MQVFLDSLNRKAIPSNENTGKVGFFPTVSLKSYHALLVGPFLKFTFREYFQTPQAQSKARKLCLFLGIYFVIIGFNCYLKILSYRYRKGKGKS